MLRLKYNVKGRNYNPSPFSFKQIKKIDGEEIDGKL